MGLVVITNQSNLSIDPNLLTARDTTIFLVMYHGLSSLRFSGLITSKNNHAYHTYMHTDLLTYLPTYLPTYIQTYIHTYTIYNTHNMHVTYIG